MKKIFLFFSKSPPPAFYWKKVRLPKNIYGNKNNKKTINQ